MFSKALAQAQHYTLPVIFVKRRWNGQIETGCGSYIVLNPDGWVLTAAHIAMELALKTRHQAEITAYLQAKDIILGDSRLHPRDKKKRLRALKENPLWVTDEAAVWGSNNSLRVEHFQFNLLSDIAVGRLLSFDPASVQIYPVFKNPTEPMLPGTSLCRLGFPFHQIDATFEEETRQFRLGKGVFPMPRFPNDGIHTRVVIMSTPDGTRQTKFIETSSPGLRGQSGGPILDCSGNIWAMQSRTQSLPLGIAPEVQQGRQKIVEHQFMHVGWGTHAEEIINFCNQLGVTITLSS